MHDRQVPLDPREDTNTSPHVLFLPKWWPNAADPQLGDFIRKQAQAVAALTKVTVLVMEPERDPTRRGAVHTVHEEGLFQVRSVFRPNTHPLKPWRKTVNLVRYWNAAMRGWRVVRRQRGMPDLVHVHILVRPALVAFWIKWVHGIPYLLSEQSSEYLNGTYDRKSFLFKALNRLLFSRSAGVTAVSAWLGDALVRSGLCRTYTVVPNVVPGLDRPLPPAGPAGHFLVVADLVDRIKNVSGVIRALAMATREVPGLRLTVIGDGPDRGDLEALVREQRLMDQVRFLGRSPNSAVLDQMAGAGAVIVNSNVETFSVVTGEALAQGKPVIATRCGGPEAFVTDENGILVDVGDTEALANAMLRLTASAGHYEPARIRQSVSARFSPAEVGTAFLGSYQRTLGTRHG